MLQRELAEHKCTAERIEVWQRGVDTVRFNPSYRCDAMRAELSDGHPEAPLLVHVGRLGAGMHPAPHTFGLAACLFHVPSGMPAHLCHSNMHALKATWTLHLCQQYVIAALHNTSLVHKCKRGWLIPQPALLGMCNSDALAV